MNIKQILAQFYPNVPVWEFKAVIDEIASEKAAEMEGPNSPEYGRLSEKFYEEMMEELNAP